MVKLPFHAQFFSHFIHVSNISTSLRIVHNRINLLCGEKIVFRSPHKRNLSGSYCSLTDKNISSEEKDILMDDSHATTFTNRLYRHPGIFHHVLVIQPRNKSGTKWELVPESERKLAEAVALINTLRQWKVIEKVSFDLRTITFFLSRDMRISGIKT